jgi:hypothetical protein
MLAARDGPSGLCVHDVVIRAGEIAGLAVLSEPPDSSLSDIGQRSENDPSAVREIRRSIRPGFEQLARFTVAKPDGF